MSGTSEKMRALFLSLIMVTSVVVGVVAVGSMSAAANAPDNGASPPANSYGAPPGSGTFGDKTRSVNTTNGLTEEITRIRFDSSGNVTEVTVNASGGSSSSGITPGDIDEVNVTLRDSSGAFIASNETSYDANSTTIDFSGTPAASGDQVARISINATISGSAADGDTIDAAVQLLDQGDSTGFPNTTDTYDTNGTQTVQVNSASLAAFVTSDQGPVGGAEVVFINVDTGTVVNPNNPLITGSDGNTISTLDVANGTYKARATTVGFSSEESSTTTLGPSTGQTFDQLDINLRAQATPKRIELDAIPDASAPADNSTPIRYRATVFGQNGTQNDTRLPNIDVSLSDDGTRIVLSNSTADVQPGAVVNTTNGNGEAWFEARSDTVQTATVNATVVTNTSAWATEPANFGVLAGEGDIPGQVMDRETTEGLEDATVYTMTSQRYRANTISVQVNISAHGASQGGIAYFRVVDADTGEVIDNDQYEAEVGPIFSEPGVPLLSGPTMATLSQRGLQDYVATLGQQPDEDAPDGLEDWNRRQWVGMVDSLNESNQSVGQGFFAADRDDDNFTGFMVTPLEPGNYSIQISTVQTNASRQPTTPSSLSDDPFENLTGTPGAPLDEDIEVSEELTSARAQADSNPSGPQLLDDTDENGDYVLSHLYTNGTTGVYYTIIAEKAGYDRDFADVLVKEDTLRYDAGEDENLILEPRDVTPVVNITNIALLPAASATPANADDPSAYSGFAYGNQTDEFDQTVPRDGSSVDVVHLETTAQQSGAPINDTVTVWVPDNFPGADSATGLNFNGSWTVHGGTVVSQDPANTTITVATGSDGSAVLLLETDQSTEDLLGVTANSEDPACEAVEFSGIRAQSTTDAGAYDASCKAFTGITQFASISGIVTDANNDPIADADVWVQSFELNATNVQVEITRINSTHANVSVYNDAVPGDTTTFGPGSPSGFFVEGHNVTWNALQDYDFGDFSPTTRQTYGLLPPSNQSGFTLYTVSGDATGFLGKYTLPRVPSKATNNDYSVKGRSPQGFTGQGDAETRTGVTDDANIVIPGALAANFQIVSVNAPAQAGQGQTITVQATVQNNGSVAAATTVDYLIDGAVVASNSTEVLSALETDTVTFTFDTSALSVGNHTQTVSTPDDSVSQNLEIVSNANFQVNSVSAPDIQQGDQLVVDAEIENTGQSSATKSVTLNINGTNVSAGTGQLDIVFLLDNSASMDPFIEAIQDALSDFAATVDQSADAQYAVMTFGNGTLTVVQDYSSSVSQTNSSLESVCPGGFCPGSTELNYDAINASLNGTLSDRSGARTVIIDVTDEGNDNQTFGGGVTPSQSEISGTIEDNDAKYIAVSPTSTFKGDENDKRVLANMTDEAAWFDINSPNLSDQFANEIATEVANASQAQQVTLNGSETKTVTFTLPGSQTSGLAPGTYDVEVSTPDDTGTTTVTVNPGSTTCPGLSSISQQYDANDDCNVDIGELGTASADYAQGQITIGELGQVAADYASTP